MIATCGGTMIRLANRPPIIPKFDSVMVARQTTENQRRELEAVAARSGWEVVDFYEDAGIPAQTGGKSAPAWIGCGRTPRRDVST
jgi:hypothetical protein